MAAALLAACGGCGPYGVPAVSSSLEETTVKGTVRVRGKPVNNGTVEFNPANVRRPNEGLRRAPINKDGTYSITTLVGENSVQVSCRELMSARNRMFAENEFALMAASGENTFDMDIGPAPQARTASNPPHTKGSQK
jgi:hypothetical protein